MPPQIALILVIIFITVILYIEHKNSKETSPVTWVLSLWLLHSTSKGLGYYLGIRTTIEEGSPPDRYFLLFLGIIGGFILLKRKFPSLTTYKKNFIILLILIYMLISVSWSRAPEISFRRWGREAIAFIMVCLLISEKSPIYSFYHAFIRVIYISLPLSLLLIKYFPLYGRQYNRWTGELSWIGVANQKNGLALLCALSAIFIIWSLWQDLSVWKSLISKLPFFINSFMLLLTIYLMMGPKRTFTYSSTSFISLLTGLSVIILLKIAANKKIKIENKTIAISLIIIFLGTFMPFAGKIPIKSLPKMLGRDETLTGRTQIWASLVPYAKKHILLGYGFGGFWTTSLREEIASHAHNGYLDTVLDLGFIGLIGFCFFLLSVIKKLAKLIDDEWSISLLFLSIVFMYLIHNIGESFFGNFDSMPSALILAISFLANEKYPNIIKNNQ
jgi:O-antigen ligase